MSNIFDKRMYNLLEVAMSHEVFSFHCNIKWKYSNNAYKRTREVSTLRFCVLYLTCWQRLQVDRIKQSKVKHPIGTHTIGAYFIWGHALIHREMGICVFDPVYLYPICHLWCFEFSWHQAPLSYRSDQITFTCQHPDPLHWLIVLQLKW